MHSCTCVYKLIIIPSQILLMNKGHLCPSSSLCVELQRRHKNRWAAQWQHQVVHWNQTCPWVEQTSDTSQRVTESWALGESPRLLPWKQRRRGQTWSDQSSYEAQKKWGCLEERCERGEGRERQGERERRSRFVGRLGGWGWRSRGAVWQRRSSSPGLPWTPGWHSTWVNNRNFLLIIDITFLFSRKFLLII